MAFLQYSPTSPLFHYCGENGFYGITESRSIWLSDLEGANDPKELQVAGIIKNLMLELINDPNTDPDLRDPYTTIERHLRSGKHGLGKFSFSLSLKGDRLPMWQEYTDRGKGFCIAFRATAFNDMPLRIQKVQYVPPHFYGSLHSQVKAIVRPLVGRIPRPSQIDVIMAAVEILTLATSVKDDTWEHEEEVRLVFANKVRPKDFPPDGVWPVSMLSDGNFVLPEDPLFRERQGRIIPYQVKQFGRFRQKIWDASNSIEQIIIGPNNDRSIDDIQTYLSDIGYKGFEVIRSRCAFR